MFGLRLFSQKDSIQPKDGVQAPAQVSEVIEQAREGDKSYVHSDGADTQSGDIEVFAG